eukprot:3518456-Prymnesium_polylepis.1
MGRKAKQVAQQDLSVQADPCDPSTALLAELAKEDKTAQKVQRDKQEAARLRAISRKHQEHTWLQAQFALIRSKPLVLSIDQSCCSNQVRAATAS